MTAFALDNVSPKALVSALSRRRQRADKTSDIYLEMRAGRRASERVGGTEIERCDA